MTRMRCPECLSILRDGYAHCPSDGHELAPCADEALIGTTIGDYILDELVGEGATGLVFRAHHARLPRRTYAIKLMFGELAADSLMRIRFAHEASAASQLSHPNVVAVVDFGRTNEGLSYLAMEFVDGEPLSDVIDREAPLAPTRTIEIARGIAQGLAHAHSKGVIHRDLKPGNIVLESRAEGTPCPRILDFGLAISAFAARQEARITENGYVVGTPTYIAPEQARDAEVDHRADLYALGVVMYEMLAGKPPFSGTAADVAMRNMTAPVPRLAETNPATSVPPELEAIVMRLLQKEPDWRYGSAAAVIAALDAAATAIEKRPGAAFVAERLSQAGLEPSRSDAVRWPVVAAAFALVALAVLGTRDAAPDADPSTSTATARADGDASAIALPHVNRADIVGSSVASAAPGTEKSVTAPGPKGRRPEHKRSRVSETADTAVEANRTRLRARGRHIASRGKVRNRQEALRLPPARSALRSSGHASTRALVREYREVGEAIARLEIPSGRHIVRDLRDRYLRLRYSTALRDASVRRKTLAALAALRREVQQASTRRPALTAAAD